MRRFHSSRWLLLALLIALIPASSFAGVFISVGFAPPVLPVYVQPVCPDPGLMWTPGYWAYGPDGYYWVPGAWVPAPYIGALWTPPWWGWSGGLYVFHPGYWGRHVGYYGGVDYGFGYMGVGFVGGMWRGDRFAYNTAVMHVNSNIVHNTYVDRTVVERNTIVNNRHVAFSGGPGGINHPPTAAEQVANHDQHLAATSFQTSHVNSAMNNKASYARNNGGHPHNLAVSRPLAAENHNPPAGFNAHGPANTGPTNTRPGNTGVRTLNRGATAHGNTAPAFQQHQMTEPRQAMNQPRQAVQPHEAPQSHAAPEYRAAPQPRVAQAPPQHMAPQPRMAQTPPQHMAPQHMAPQHMAPQHMAPPPRMAQAPQQHAAPQPHGEGGHEHGHGR